MPRHFFIPGLDNTRLFMSFTAGAGTRCMSLLSSSKRNYYKMRAQERFLRYRNSSHPKEKKILASTCWLTPRKREEESRRRCREEREDPQFINGSAGKNLFIFNFSKRRS
jgi:hypothetical protein